MTGIILAGGQGQRMNAPLPKQYLLLKKKPIACHSLEIFLNHPEMHQIIVVCAPEYRTLFSEYHVEFADPGERRQDSLFNGLKLAKYNWICTHDAARPYLTHKLIDRLIQEGKNHSAVTLGIPIKNTIKECDSTGFVLRTLNRESIWEIQTPQLVKKHILIKGFAFADRHNITVSDDVSLAELIDHPVKLVLGSQKNIKITTPEDLCFKIK
ncbi:MAG: 2-C-methyl-D-erythritol 4-phosphate cytidylyltransferase [Chlamydiales bacterium]